jgi:hypothetical protein
MKRALVPLPRDALECQFEVRPPISPSGPTPDPTAALPVAPPPQELDIDAIVSDAASTLHDPYIAKQTHTSLSRRKIRRPKV